MQTFTQDRNTFFLNGKKINIYSGTIHYFRVLPNYWEDRLLKLKAAGLNTVETYVAWNFHSQRPGEYDFSGMRDLVKFLKIAQKLGLHAIVRPGPYICAEWDFGGFPAYLLEQDNIKLRTHDPKYLNFVYEYLNAVFEQIRPMLITNGGNIIMVQIENEYGSYGDDHIYLQKLADFYRASGIDVLLFTSDGAEEKMITNGSIPGIMPTLNFGSNVKDNLMFFRKKFGNHYPFMCAEFWCGWFDHWGEHHHTRSTESVVEDVKTFLQNDGNFNFYMFFGGTNFGMMSGANCGTEGYAPTITSYDYHGLLTENGDYTETYHQVRKLLLEHQGLPFDHLPPSPQTQEIGSVNLTHYLPLFAIKDHGNHIVHGEVKPMEKYGQSHGLIAYQVRLLDKDNRIKLIGLGDRAYVFLNERRVNIIDRRNSLSRDFELDLPKEKGELMVLVEAMGRVNYGPYLEDHKGLTSLLLNQLPVEQVHVTTYSLSDISQLTYEKKMGRYPMFCKGTFQSPQSVDTFLHLDGFTKGYVFINGFNLGRYWNIGPQKSLYVPGSLLKNHNELVVLELEGTTSMMVAFRGKSDLG